MGRIKATYRHVAEQMVLSIQPANVYCLKRSWEIDRELNGVVDL